jgi:membrane peptidoglycan carboxypeptidase
MAYRPPRRAAVPRGSGVRRQPSRARSIAIARASTRRGKSGGSPLALISGILVFAIVAVTATSIAAAGVGVQSTLASMEDGLPDVNQFESLKFAQPTKVFDRTGKIQLANFQQERRRVVTFEELPHLVLDATVATEDKTFWTNPGYDSQAIVRSALRCFSGDCSSGASTITQQFVRARLLPPELLAPSYDDKVRKVKEILQSAHLTEYVTKTYGEQPGKERIITAYLNQIFYGHNAYGIAGAASAYFGKTLDKLTPAEAAVLAAIAKSPVCYDLYSWLPRDEGGAIVKDDKGQLVVPLKGAVPPVGCDEASGTTSIVARRNSILRDMAQGADPHTGKGYGRWTSLTPTELQEALNEPIVLAGDQPNVFKAPHFVWAMKVQLDQILSDREPAESGGYTITTTLDMDAQAVAEKFVTAATIVPQLKGSAYQRAIRQFKLQKDQDWIDNLRNKGIHNGALVAMDYSNGDVLAYVGSAGYYRDDLASKKFNPKYDVAGVGFRAPGSAFKPVVYTTAFDQRKLTPGSVLLDITTTFAPNANPPWAPKDADLLERGPVLARKALQYSLNIPAMRAIDRVGPATVDAAAQKAGLQFKPGFNIERAGLAGAIGTVELHLQDLVAVYGAFGNAGVVNEPRLIMDIKDPSGNSIYTAGDPIGRKVWSPQAAWLMADILAGNTNPRENSIWGPRFRLDNGPGGAYRPAGLKTGTTNDVKDISAYGLLPKPKNPKEPAIALGVWMGNSNGDPPTLGNAVVFASDGPGEVWHSFMRDYMAGKPVADFERPKGLVQQTIDAYSGGSPGPWTRDTVNEWFINGTQPGGNNAVDPAGILYTATCGTWMVDPVKAENKGAPAYWVAAVRDWARRASRGVGVMGALDTRTAYFFGRGSWGGPITVNGSCGPPPTSAPTPDPDATPRPPRDTPAPDATPRKTPRVRPTPKPDPTPAPTCRPNGNPPGCIPVVTPPPVNPGAEPTPAPAAEAARFGLVQVGAKPAAPAGHIPVGLLNVMQPGIVTGPTTASPVRLSRRRHRRPRHRG